MDSECMDHYEKQLYTVFKTFDVDNEEALDKTAVLNLCDALQLEDRGTALVGTLFEKPVERVTFTQFRNGLLSVLGAGDPVESSSPPPDSAPLAHSDDDSSSRELPPKFIVGAKRYGRRSRPAAPSTPVSHLDIHNISDSENEKIRRRMKNKRNSTSFEIADQSKTINIDNELDHERKINYEQSIALCRNLNMGSVDLKLIKQIFQDFPSSDITVGDFFDKLHSSLSLSIASACESNSPVPKTIMKCDTDDTFGATSLVSADAVVEAWENAGIDNSQHLLLELGFTSNSFRASELSQTLDEEISAFTNSDQASLGTRSLLLQASLALQRLRLSLAGKVTEATRAENVKLRSDLTDANQRAQTLAQEVDDNHARIEASLKSRIKSLEARHNEELRTCTLEYTNDKERYNQTIAKLEESVARLTSEENKLKSKINSMKTQHDELARRASLAEERSLQLETAKQALANEVKLLTQSQKDVSVDNGSLELENKIEELKIENKMLRDKNDELCAELEVGLRIAGGVVDDVEAASWREEAAGLFSPRRPSSQHNEDLDQSYISLDQKVISQSEVTKKLQSLLELMNQSINDESSMKDTFQSVHSKVQELADSMILDQPGLKVEMMTDASAQTDGDDERLKQELIDVNKKHEKEKEELINNVKELETSLEQLKYEFDKEAEFWESKLVAEQKNHEEEIQSSDDKLNELILRISEYEQQFEPTKQIGLATIDERDSLESQFNDLDQEYTTYKQEKEKEIELRDAHINDLKEKIKTLELKIAEITPSHISYLFSQGTINSPRRRDYANPAFIEENVRCSSDSEHDRRAVNPIQRPSSRSASVPLEGDEVEARQMINCSELEGRLRQQAQLQNGKRCQCAELEAKCRHLANELRHRHLYVEAIQQASRAESNQLRARILSADEAVSRLQARLAAADLLVKDLYIENCQLVHNRMI